MGSILVNHLRYLITADNDRRGIRDGALVIEDGDIVAVGKSGILGFYGKADRVVDGTHWGACPSFINYCYTHTLYSPLRGLATQIPARIGLSPGRLGRRME